MIRAVPLLIKGRLGGVALDDHDLTRGKLGGVELNGPHHQKGKLG